MPRSRPRAPDCRILTRPSPRPTPPGRASGQPPTSLSIVDSPRTTASLAGCFAPHCETGSRGPPMAGHGRVVLFLSTQGEATGFPPRGQANPPGIIGPCRDWCQIGKEAIWMRTNARLGSAPSGKIVDPVSRPESLPYPALGCRDLLRGKLVRNQAKPLPKLLHHVVNDFRARQGRLLPQRAHPFVR